MMKTETILCVDLADLIDETRIHENLGWATRQIIMYPPRPDDDPPDSLIIVIFEKDQEVEWIEE